MPMAKKREARFIISAENKTAATIGKITGDVGKLGGAFSRMGKLVGPALAGLAGGATLKGFASMIQRANDLTDSLRDSSIRLGVGISDLQAYQLAAGNAGIEAGALTSIIGKLNKAAGEIKLGSASDKTVDAFRAIGISVAEVERSKPAELFEKVIEGLGGIQDPATRAALAMQVFGKSGQTALTLVADGTGGLRESRKLLDEMGLSLTNLDADNVDEANDALGTLSFVAQAAKQKIGAELAPTIQKLGTDMLEAGKNGETMGQRIESGVAGSLLAIEKVITFVRALGSNFEVVRLKLAQGFANILSYGARLILFFGEDAPNGINKMKAAVEEGAVKMQKAFSGFATTVGTSVVGALNKAIETVDRLINAAAKGISELIDLANKVPGVKLPTVKYSQTTGQIGPFKVDIVEALGSEGKELPSFSDSQVQFYEGLQNDFGAQSIGYAADAAQAAEDASAAWTELWDLYGDTGVLPSKPVEDVADALDTATDKAEGLASALGGGSSGSSGGSGGGKGGVAGALEDVTENALRAVEVFDQMEVIGAAAFSGIEQAIDQVTKTGKLDFADMARSILSDIAAIIAKGAILGGIFGSAQYGGDGKGLVGSLVSGYLTRGSSFAGGGFTGMGSRSGGIDGKGGFPAILHPNETVVDHAAGQSMGGGTTINQTIMVRETLPSGIAAQIAKQASQQAQAALKNISDRGGNRRRSFSFA